MATKKKSRKSGEAGSPAEAAEARDPREPIQPSPAAFKQTVEQVAAIVATLTPPAEPHGAELVSVMLHMVFAAGLPCGYGQETRRRIEEEYVDRNEYRVTEAYDTEEILADLQLPDAFERCRTAKNAIVEIYNDQNAIALEFLREAGVSDRKSFFQRVPAIPADVAAFLAQVVDFEELLFSPRSTQRVQARLGLEGVAGVDKFLEDLRALVQPFGHLPIDVGPNRPGGKPILDPELSPLCAVHRLLGKS